MGMTGLDIATSISLNNDVEKRNSLQKTVGLFSEFWKGINIQDLRNKTRKRKPVPPV